MPKKTITRTFQDQLFHTPLDRRRARNVGRSRFRCAMLDLRLIALGEATGHGKARTQAEALAALDYLRDLDNGYMRHDLTLSQCMAAIDYRYKYIWQYRARSFAHSAPCGRRGEICCQVKLAD